MSPEMHVNGNPADVELELSNNFQPPEICSGDGKFGFRLNTSLHPSSDSGPEPDDILTQYSIELSKKPPLTQEEELQLANTMVAGRWFVGEGRTLENIRLTEPAREAFNELAERNLRLVFSIAIAKKYQDRGLELIDIIGFGNIGLLKGIAAFEPDKGPLVNYTGECIRNEISNAMYHRKDSGQVESISMELLTDMGSNNENEFQIFDPNVNIERQGDEYLLHEQVRQIWKEIPNERDRRIIGFKYGFIDGREHSFDEIARICGLSRQRTIIIEMNIRKAIKPRLSMYRDSISVFDS
jgi:RNA polymerase sigma factor (sigma-70 family)